MDALIDKHSTTKHYPPEIFRNDISKREISSVSGNMDYVIPSLYSDSATTSERKKNCRDTFIIQTKKKLLSIKAEDNALFKNRQKTCLCTEAINVHSQPCIGKNISSET